MWSYAFAPTCAFMPCAGTTLRFLLLQETLSPADLLGTYFESQPTENHDSKFISDF